MIRSSYYKYSTILPNGRSTGHEYILREHHDGNFQDSVDQTCRRAPLQSDVELDKAPVEYILGGK
jgi:hypothetical protein